mgnify:CR=1 FL=1
MNSHRPAARRAVDALPARALLIFLLALPAGAGASSVQQVGTEQLLSGSELVVHATVLDSRTEAGPVYGTVTTVVRLQIVDLLKGEDPSSTIEIAFAGGEHGGLVQVVSGMNIPLPGEEGIYFIESAGIAMVNPLYGWTQGHYLIDPVDRSVRTYGGKPVYGITSTPGPAALTLAFDEASGIMTEPTVEQPVPLQADQFIALIDNMLRALP